MQKIKNFSPQQKLAMSWWSRKPYCDYDAIICDGAVRSGKTLAMSIGFVSWAMTCFQNGSFALCGKTITSLKRNVMTPLLELLGSLGFTCLERVSRNYVDISLSGRTNRFYLFGGRDESSAALIQGMTLCGVFLDEVALMPRSFVEQALARCSVTGSRLWFNCNPDHPNHWFYREWIRKTKENTPCISISPWRTTPLFPSVCGSGTNACTAGHFMTGLYWASGRRRTGWCIPCLHRNAMWCRRLRPVTATGSPVITAQ